MPCIERKRDSEVTMSCYVSDYNVEDSCVLTFNRWIVQFPLCQSACVVTCMVCCITPTSHGIKAFSGVCVWFCASCLSLSAWLNQNKLKSPNLVTWHINSPRPPINIRSKVKVTGSQRAKTYWRRSSGQREFALLSSSCCCYAFCYVCYVVQSQVYSSKQWSVQLSWQT